MTGRESARHGETACEVPWCVAPAGHKNMHVGEGPSTFGHESKVNTVPVVFGSTHAGGER